MKIALLTIWHEKNYGAEMQAYATIKALQQLGHEVKMIDIRLSDSRHPSVKSRLASIISSFSPNNCSFNKFWKKYIPTTIRYRSIKELQANPPDADIYMVGSDQVWNPDITGTFAQLYFLNFGSEKIIRISYASSFGTPQWNYPNLNESIKKLLCRFNAITCREKSGADILKNEFGIDAKVVLDPTLLHKNYPELTHNLQEKNTLVYYPLSHDSELQQFSEQLAKRINLIPVNNNEVTYLIKSVVWNRTSITEWISNIAQAKFVITRSFHGVAFCLIYHRQFAVIEGIPERSTRITNLLEQLGIPERFFKSINELNSSEIWLNPIDYCKVDSRLEKLRTDSRTILNGITDL